MRIAVVRLDNAQEGAGPGTVIAVADDIHNARQAHRDRDGCIDQRLRFWVAEDGTEVGHRVTLRQYE